MTEGSLRNWTSNCLRLLFQGMAASMPKPSAVRIRNKKMSRPIVTPWKSWRRRSKWSPAIIRSFFKVELNPMQTMRKPMELSQNVLRPVPLKASSKLMFELLALSTLLALLTILWWSFRRRLVASKCHGYNKQQNYYRENYGAPFLNMSKGTKTKEEEACEGINRNLLDYSS